MRAPPLFLAFAVMFWAWHAQVLLLGAAMAMVLESPRVVQARWQLGPPEFGRIADLCTWSFVILAAYLSFTRGMPIPILEIFHWLPLVMLPLMTAQLYSEAERLPLSSLFLMLRGKHRVQEDSGIDLTYPYAIVCAVAAGAANLRNDSYYYGLALLTAWALWPVRSKRYPAYVWMSMIVCIAALGFAGHVGLSRLQQLVMESTPFSGTRTDPYKAMTDIGQIGDLKQSDGIVVRVSIPPGVSTPLLLHRASYNAYASPSWLAREAKFEPVAAQADGTWVIAENVDIGQSVDAPRIGVSEPVSKGKAVLSLPGGTARIEDLSAARMERNALGAVQIESREDLVSYRAVTGPGAISRDPPQEIDLRVPRSEAPHLDELVERLQLKGRPVREVLAIVGTHFERDFAYSTYLSAPQPQSQRTPLADFLLVTRAGHCEYFATATTLLLRAAGIPARYATGFSVQEWSDLEGAYVARERHAHAWVRVRVDEHWVDFDTTPPTWFAVEARGASFAQPLMDLWSWVAHRFARWQSEDPQARTIVALAFILPLAAILVWRLIFRKPLAARRERKAAVASRRSRPGADSEFYQVEAWLARAGCARAAHEPMGMWLARLGRERPDVPVAALHDLLRLHYRYRFDPDGLSEAERRALGARAQRWLESQKNL